MYVQFDPPTHKHCYMYFIFMFLSELKTVETQAKREQLSIFNRIRKQRAKSLGQTGYFIANTQKLTLTFCIFQPSKLGEPSSVLRNPTETLVFKRVISPNLLRDGGGAFPEFAGFQFCWSSPRDGASENKKKCSFWWFTPSPTDHETRSKTLRAKQSGG